MPRAARDRASPDAVVIRMPEVTGIRDLPDDSRETPATGSGAGGRAPASAAGPAAADTPDHHTPFRVLPLAGRFDAAQGRHGVVHDLPLEGIHRLEAFRTPRPLHPPGDPLRTRGELRAPALSIVLDVHDHPASALEPALDGPADQLLQGIQRLAVPADQQPHPV